MGSIYDHHADLTLNNEYQISGNWKASIDFTRTVDDEFPYRFDAWGRFSLWLNENQKISISVGGGGDNWGGMQDSISFGAHEWNGTWGPSAPVSIGKVKFNWDPVQWHTASIEKRGNIYSVFVDNACIGHYIDNFLNGQGKIGMHTYGTKRHDTAKNRKRIVYLINKFVTGKYNLRSNDQTPMVKPTGELACFTYQLFPR